MTKLLVIWDSNIGDAVPEGKIDEYVIKAVNEAKPLSKNSNRPVVCVIGCLVLFNRFRLASVLDDIEEDDITYLVDGVEYTTNNTRLPACFPNHVGAKFDDYLDMLLGIKYESIGT